MIRGASNVSGSLAKGVYFYVSLIALTIVVSSAFASSELQLCAVSTCLQLCLLGSGVLVGRATIASV